MNDQIDKRPLYLFTNFTLLNNDEKLLVWKWRNHDAIRRWMYDSSLIPFEDHLKFIASLHGNKLKTYYLVHREEIPIGVISITAMDDASVDLGFYLSPDHHKKHLGIEINFHVFIFLFETLRVKRITGYIKVENLMANSLIQLFGFDRKIVYRMDNGKKTEYSFFEMNSEKWFEEVKTNKTILERMGRSYQI